MACSSSRRLERGGVLGPAWVNTLVPEGFLETSHIRLQLECVRAAAAGDSARHERA